MSDAEVRANDIAVVGMSGRFPGARNVDEFWRNLCNGVHSISRFSEEELIAAGNERRRILQPDFVNAGGVLDGIEMFDAGFFGFNPREAETLDPQQRVFLECAWEALESAGCDPERYHGTVGVFSGCVMSTYLFNVLSHPEILDSVGAFQVFTGNDKDHLGTRVSYKLNLRGPSIAVQTACSTSLVAVSMACQSLIDSQCDMALAGGVAIRIPQSAGYIHQEGMIYSREGCCRPFDARADGTVFANGVGIVALKRLDDALRDCDNIHAVIRGWALNNDGATKVGYTAPSLEGQIEVIALAHAMADIAPETVTHVEAHGTGTSLGDPIEIAALTQAFRMGTDKTGFAALSSVKSNIGHLDVAAGVAGLIKAVLELKHKLLVPSLHFEKANASIDFSASPFYVNTALAEWRAQSSPRRAGVSSFGIGGTNAHVILEEAPQNAPTAASQSAQLIVLSAKTPSALNAATANLAAHLHTHPDLHLADVALTLQRGRRAFDHRRAMVCQQVEQAAALLEQSAQNRAINSIDTPRERPVVFLFPGQGTQQVGMARHIYESEESFRDDVDLCLEVVQRSLGEDLRTVLYPAAGNESQAQEWLNETVRAQPSLFIVEYALARLWMKWGIRPAAMLGHSIGEYVAACLAGVFSLEDALSIIAERGRLVQQMPPGAMLAISLPEPEASGFLEGGLDIAAVNDPSSCVVSGSAEAIADLEHRLQCEHISCQRLSTSHAFHSRMMDPMLPAFGDYVSSKTSSPSNIPYVLNVTAQWADMRQPQPPAYWQQHLRRAVRFGAGLEQIYQNSPAILLEVGPGETLTRIARRHPSRTSQHVVLASQPPAGSAADGRNYMLGSLGNLWTLGQSVDWDGFHAPDRPRRVSLPTYPFERQSYWIERAPVAFRREPREERLDISDWCLLPYWRPTAPAPDLPESMSKSCWLVFADDCGLAAELTNLLRQHEQKCVVVEVGERFQQLAPDHYRLDPNRAENYIRLVRRLSDDDLLPQNLVHLWSVSLDQQEAPELERFQTAQVLGLHSLLNMTHAWDDAAGSASLRIFAISSEMHTVLEADGAHPEKATLLGACRVIPQEYPRISCSSIDVVVGPHDTLPRLAAMLLRETAAGSHEELVAIRNGRRWVQSFQRMHLDSSRKLPAALRSGGTYLITGGLGGIGLALASYLGTTVQAKLALLSKTAFPERHAWQAWLDSHDSEEKISSRIRAIQKIESAGGQVLVVSADVANVSELSNALRKVELEFGTVHGVIHAAGVPGGVSIRLRSGAAADPVLSAKAKGALILQQAFEHHNLDFLIFCSSLSSLLGGTQADYAGANAFLDALAQRLWRRNVRAISINWDAWKEVGMAAQAQFGNERLLARAMSSNEGVQIFARVLEAQSPQVAVATTDFDTALRHRPSISTIASGPALPASAIAGSESRPVADAPRAADDVERVLAEIWKELLGVKQVTLFDNFFDLGGHSLLGTRLLDKLRGRFQVELPLRSLLEVPTIAGMAERIRSVSWAMGRSPARTDTTAAS